MAVLLIKAVDAVNDDPAKDASGCYKRGDVVVVLPDGHQWGRKEGPPNFFRLKIPGLSVAEAEELMAAEVDVEGNAITRRARRLMADSIPAEIRKAIAEKGEVALPKIIFDRFNESKREQLTKFAQRAR